MLCSGAMASLLLNPRQIEAFRWVMLRGSVTAAAQQLGISQPAASRLIHDLESRTGLALFERHGNHLTPTAEAELLLGEVERYATGLQAISRFAEDLQQGRRGQLRVIALPAIAMGFLPRFVARFVAGRAMSNVFVHGMPSHLVVEAVSAGQADIGIAAAPADRPGLRIEPLESRAVLAVPTGHRLARRRTVGERDLAGERFIQLAEPTIFASQPEPRPARAAVDRVVTTPLSGIACSLVAAGTGIAIVDPFAASDHVGRGIVAIRYEPAIPIRIAIVTSSHRRPSALARAFVDAFRGHAKLA